jgi:hypothetical protein
MDLSAPEDQVAACVMRRGDVREVPDDHSRKHEDEKPAKNREGPGDRAPVSEQQRIEHLHRQLATLEPPPRTKVDFL